MSKEATVESSFDYIIIGAGGTGAVLANRLSEDPRKSVLLLERGGNAFNPMLHIPKGFFFTLTSNTLTRTYQALPFGPLGYNEPWQRGSVLGGSTAVNGMMYVRGQKADYEDLGALAGEQWGWENFLRAYRAMEDHQLGPDETRGAGGPLGVTIEGADDETVDLVLEAARNAGIPQVEDVNAQDQEQIGFTPSTIKNGIRQSTALSFLWPIRKRRNLTILTHAEAGSLIFEGKRATGVRLRHRDQKREVFARKEVVLAAGTIETPLLLERSGIGRGDILSRARIPQVVESPGVGEGIIEQHGVNVQVKFRREIGKTLALSTRAKQLGEGARYLATREGPIGTGGYDLMAHFKSSPEVDRPDTQAVIVPFGLDFSEGMNPAKEPSMYMLGYQIRPETTSSLHATDWSPNTPPTIHARYFETDEDRRVTTAAVDRLRDIVSQSPITEEILEEEVPGKDVKTPEQIMNHASSPGITIYHAVGSAAMGRGEMSVVEPDLRVRGVDGLRVADVSILPTQVCGNTAAPAMAIGWLAADMLRDSE